MTLGGTTVTNGSHALSVNENSTASYSIKLNSRPTGDVRIRPRAGSSSSITLETVSLVFTTTNWNVAQSVTVRAANDPNRVDESVEITHTISGGGYGSVAVPGVTVTASDDDKSSNNELLFLSLQSVTLSPAFSRTRTSYTANVANSVSRVTVSTRARDRTATVSITPADADAVASGHQVNLGTASVNNIRVRVTAENGDVRDYTVAVTRAKSTTPSSFSFTDQTGVEPGTEVTSDQITVSVETGSPAISVSSGGTLVVDGTDFTGNSVTNGQKVAVKVTASSSFSTKKSVTVTIGGVSDEFSVTTRAANGNANLSSIGLSSGTLDPAVSADRTTYTIRVGSSVNKIKVTPNTAHSAARVKVNRGSYAAGGTQSPYIYFPFRGSLSRFSIVVTVRAEDGTEKQYRLRVSRQSRDAYLSGLSVSAGGSELVLARSSGGSTVAGFDRRTTAYTVRVPQTTTSVEVTPTTSEPRATVRCCIGAGGQVTRDANGRLVATTVSLQSSTSTVLSVVVTPEDSGAPQRTYTVTVEKTSKRVSVDPVSLTVGEGRTATYTVSLAGEPTGTVTVTPASGNTAVATVSGSLAFNAANWRQAQTITVTGVDNRQADAVSGRRTTVTHTVSGGGYDGAAAATVGVKVTDVPAASITSTNPSSLREDNLDGATVTVTLSGAIYVAGLDEDDFELASAPSGTTISSAVRNSALAATLTLAYDDTDFDAAAKLGVRVLATGHTGTEALATGEVDVAAVAETTPAAPTGLTATARNLSAALSWTDPSDAAITGYEYRRKLTSASSYGPWTPMTGSGASTTSYTVGGLSNGLAYDFQIRAVNSRAPTETSAASATASATPAPATAPVTSNREWHTPDTGWAVHYDGWAVRTTSLAASAARQRVDFTFRSSNSNVRATEPRYYTVLGCPFTSAVINQHETRPRGCETVAGSPINPDFFGHFSGNLTPTRAMIANGGVVFVMWYARGSIVEAVYAKWVPLEGGAAITKTNPSALGEGNLNRATVTVDLTGSTFNAGVGVGDFELTGVPAGATVRVSSVARSATETDMATLTLSFRGNFNADFSLGVTAKASGHTGTQDLTAGTVRVAAVVEPPTLSGLEILGVRGTLSRGVVSESRSALSPSPAFSGETTSYAVTVPATMEHVRIVPTAREPWNVTITVDGTAYGSGNLTGRIKLAAVGTGKTINVVVTPNDPSLSAGTYTYVVTVTREAATITPSVTTLDARVGTAITDVTFTTGGAGFSPTGWSVDPALPQGLSMDSGTGTISGTPRSAAEATDYTVTGIGESSLTVRGFQRRHQASATVRITVNTGTDDAGVEFSSGTAVAADTGKRGLTVNEGSTADYTIALTEEPSGTVTVRPVVRGSTDVTISPFWLEFTTQNYDTAQSFTVRAGSDGDAADDLAVISHTATGGGYDGTLIESVTVTVEDDEEVGLVVTRTTETDGSHGLTVTEGSTNTYDVALGSEPGSSVTVTPVLAPGTDVTVTPGSLEFDSTNWETAKSFTVEAREDDDATDDTVKIRHSMSGGDSYYDGKSGPVVTVTVDDDDDFGVTLGITPATDGTYGLSVNEDSTASYTMKLDAEPTGDVTIRPTAGESASVSVETKFLSFTVNDWNVAQSVTVKGLADGNASDESVEITHSISGGGYGSVTIPAVTVTAVDDDKSSDNDLKALAISSVTLSPAFNRAVTTYTASVPNSVSRVTVAAVANDGAAEISITPADADANTGGHQVDLDTASVNNITISVTAQTGGVKNYAVAVTRAKSVTPASFSFTDATGAEPGAEVTSDAIDVDVEDTAAAIPISVTSGGTLVVDGSVFTGNTVTDGQRVAVRLTASSDFSAAKSATVTIGGVSDEFSVTTRAASGNADLSSIGLSSGTLDPAVSAERTTYTVRVGSGVNRIKVTPNTADARARVKVNRGSYAASGTESPYINFPFGRGRGLSRFGIVVTVRAEDGTEKKYTLRVARQSRDAHLSGLVVAAGGGELALGRSSGGSTVAGFDRGTTAYTVRVPQATTGVEVKPTTSDPRATVTVAGNAVTRDGNGRLPAATVNLQSGSSTTVSVVVTPEDTSEATRTYTVTVEKTERRVIVSPVSLVLGEGSAATYTVSLAGAPTGPVTVTPSSGNTAVATVSGALTFPTGDWSTPRTVTVTGVDNRLDDPASGRRTTVTHTVAGGGYGGAAAATVRVSVTDEAATIAFTSPTPLTEGNLDGAVATVDVSGGLAFSDGVDKDDFEISGVPRGVRVWISAASRDGSNRSRAELTLSYGGADFDSDFSLGVTAKASGHTGTRDLATETVRVAAVVEPPTLSGLEVLGVRGTLSRGVVSESRSALAPSPAFSGETRSYAVTVPATMEHVRILPTAREPWNVTITVDGTAYGSGNLTGRIKLSAVGTGKRINVVVTPRDPGLSATAYTYVVTVTREAAAITPSTTTLNATAGTAVTAVTFTSGGEGFSPTSWSVDPELPQGLSMDSGTGRISGTPRSAAAAADYTVTATGESSLTALGVERVHQASATVRITVDPEVTGAGATISTTSLTVNEGSTADYTIALSAQPTGTVTVRLSASGSGDVSIDTSSLEFTQSNWNQTQTVTVTAGEDGDVADDAAAISHTASGGGYDGAAIDDVAVTVNDDDSYGATLEGTTVTNGSHGLSVNEDSTATYTIKLDAEPTGDVTIRPTAAQGSSISVETSFLRFTPRNWNVAKEVKVKAAADANAVDESVLITHSISGGGYGSVTVPDVTVTADDDDGSFGVTVEGTTVTNGSHGLSVNEDSAASYSIKLDAEPTGDVTIRPRAGSSSSISVETSFLRFTTDNWSVAQSVTVKASDDGNGADESVLITHAIEGGGYGSVAVPGVTVTAVDDDKSSDNDLRAMRITSVTLDPAFSADRTTYAANVPNSVSRVTVVAVASAGSAEVSITPADADANTRGHQVDLVTTAVNTITIRVTAQDGAEKDYAVAVTRAKSVTPASFAFTDVTEAEPGAEVTSPAITVSGIEADNAPISVSSGGTLLVNGSVFTGNTVANGQTVAVRLRASSEFSTAKSATVTIGGVSDEFSVTTRAVSGNADLSSIGLSSGALDPAVSAGRTEYTVRVGSGVNGIKVTPETAHSGARVKVNRGSYAAGGTQSPDIYFPFGRGLSRFSIVITVRAEDGTEKRYTLRVSRHSRDAHLSGLVVEAGGGELALGRSSGGSTVAGFDRGTMAYTVRVPQAATSVEVTPTTSDPRATVTVNGVAATRDAGGRLTAATVSVSTSPATVSVVVTPEDSSAPTRTYTVTVEKTTRRVIVDPVSLTVGEGSSATYTVRLAGQPTGTVTVTPVSGNTSAATVSGALSFTTGNWNAAQTVTVRGVDDRKDNPASGRRTAVAHTVTGGGYDGAAAASVSVRVTDEAVLIQSTSPAPLTEENLDTATITVDLAGGLDFKPGVDQDDFELSGVPAGVTVSISTASRDGSDDSRAELTLSYDDADFDSDFSMRVTAEAGGHTGSSNLVTSPVRVTATDETPAARPTGLSARGAPQSAVLTWTNPTDSTITGYQVSRKLSTAPSWGTWAAISGSDSTTVTHTVTSLTNGTRYDFRIRALVLKADPSTASASASATPEAEGASIQSTTPTSLSEANLNGATVTVDLAGGLDFNLGVDKDDFSLSGLPSGVTVSISAASRDATNHYRAALTLSYDATDATDDFDSAFNLGVTAEAAGHTGSSNLSTGTVEVTATAETAAAKPANLRAAVGNAQVVLTWDNPSDALITGYEYQQRDGANWPTAWTTMTSSGATTTTYTATGLTNGTAYHFRIRALRFKAPESAASDSASATPSLQSVAIQSTSPTSLSEANLNGATVTVDLAGGLEFNSDADKDDFELTGLPQGTTVSISTASRDATNLSRAALTLSYDAASAANDFDSNFNLGVKARAAGHTGATDLSTSTVEVTATAENAAAKPTGLSARGGPRSAVLTWTNPSDSTITGYEYQQRTGSSWPTGWTTMTGSGATTTTYTVTGLANGTAHDFRIRALVFKAPESPASDAASATPAALGASIQSTSPTSLTEASLNGATVTVDLAGGLDFQSGVGNNDFELTGVPAGITVSISATARNATNHSRAALTLSHSGNFDVSFNLGVRARASGHTGSSDLVTGTVAVTATRGVSVSPTSLTIDESGTGNSAKYRVKLDSRPSGQVTITPAGTANVAVTTAASDNKLRFTAQNWNSEQEVTVTAVDDKVDNANNRTATVSHTVTGADYGSVTASDVSVTLTDDDTKSVIISKSSATINESGAGNSFTYTVRLGSMPSGTVTVTVSPPSGIATADTASLSFAATGNNGRWDQAQTVTVTAVDDRVDNANNRSGNVTHTVTGADYQTGVTPGSIAVTLTDDDAAGVTVSQSSLSVTEAGSGVDYTVVLTSQPSANVTVDISSADADVKVKTGSGTAATSLTLTFTPTGTGIWSTAQTVTVTAADDADTVNETVTLTQSIGSGSASEYSSVNVANVTVNVADDDTPNLDVSRTTALALAEGASSTYNVKLTTQPSSDVVVEISSDNSDVTVKKAGAPAAQSVRLTFTPSGAGIWSTAQTVTVASVADTDSLDDSATITHRVVPEDSDNDYDPVSSKTFTVAVTDSTLAGLAVADASAAESAGTLDFTVTLAMASSRTVTVNWALTAGTATAGTATTGDYDATTAGGTLTFTSGSSLSQTVSVPINDDPVVEPDETVTVTISSASGATISDSTATGTIRNDDDAGVRVAPERSQRTTTEDNAGTVDLMVSLSSRPSADVTVTVTSADTTEGRVKESEDDADPTLDFTAGTWDTAQTVTVTGVDDDDLDGDVEYNVRFAFSSTDTDYDGLDPVDVALTNLDDDLSILSVSGGGEVAEGDSGTTAQATFTVTLSPARRQAVSVSYATSDGTAEAGSDYESASGTVTFSPGETAQTVTVTINGDDEAEANETFTLALTSTPNGQIDPQNSSAQAVITNDDEKMVDAGMSGEFSVGETTVTVDSTLPDDTGLEVVLPSELESGGAAIDELTVTLGSTDAQIDADLFGYTGNGEDHVLVDIDISPVPDAAVRVCLPITEGLRRAAGSQRLYIIRFSSGEWEELSSETEDDMVCADVRGFSPFAVVFQIDYAKRRVGEVNRAILPELARAMTASTLEAITSRIEDARAGAGAANSLNAQAPPEPEPGHQKPRPRLGEFEDGETLSLTEAVDGSYYSVSLAGGYDAPSAQPEAELSPAPRSGRLGMWVSGDYRSISGKGGGLADWNGRLISGHLGADYRFGRSFLAGVATSWSHGSFDYTGGGEGSTRVSGDYSSRMNSFHPYLGVFLSERLDLWASAGWGFGEIKMDDGEIPVRQKASARLGTLAAGADLALLGGGASALSLKGEAWISRVKLKNNGDRIEGIRINANRLRAALQGSHALSLGSGSSLVPSLEFGIRRDGGDGETGVGGELAGGVSLASSFGLTLEARGRALLFHQGDAREWGVGGSVTFDPGGDGRGLSMSVLPSWGNGSSGVQGLWDAETAADLGTSASTRNFGLETEVGYGFPALGDRGLLTPYGAFGRPDPDSRNYRFGSRFSLNRALDLTLEGQRRELRAGDPEHELTVQGRLNW